MRTNGSILGTYQNLVTTPRPSGIYSLNEVNTLVKQNAWEYSYFPSAYNDLIDTFPSANRTYVKNYSELYAAVQSAPSGTSTAIILGKGTYELGTTTLPLLADIAGGTGADALLSDAGKPITFICAPGQVLFSWSRLDGGGRDAPMFYFTNSSSAVYGGFFKRDNGGTVNSYSASFTRGPGAVGNVYNCVFKEINANGNWSRNYLGTGTNTYTINYTSIWVGENGMADYSNSAGASWNNCTNNWAKGTGSTPWSGPENVSYNSDFTITGNTTDGVYAGTYGWYQPKTTLTTSS